MSAKKGGLGRSFSSLIPDDLLDESFDPSASDDHNVSDLRSIKLSEILADPEQPRRHFDESGISELSESIKIHGVLQPIVVTPKKGKYEIVAGERRFRASLVAGKQSIPALVRTLTNQHKLELALIENIQRRDLNPMELAVSYAKLRDQFNLSLEQIGERVGGRSVSAVSNVIRLLKLPHTAKEAVAKGELTEGQARPLIGSNEDKAKELVPQIIAEGWSARKIEAILRSQTKPQQSTNTEKPVQHTALSKKTTANVTVQVSKRGAGKFVIPFASEAERERIEKLLLS